MPGDAVTGDGPGAMLYRETCAKLAAPSEEERAGLALDSRHPDTHEKVAARLDVLRQIETGGPAHGTETDRMRVVFWNAERCKHLDASVALARAAGADTILLAEMDYGMARSGQRHTTREMSRRLGAQYAFAVEFLELGLGDAKETRKHRGQINRVGLHGNAVLARNSFRDPVLIRFPMTDDWYLRPTDQRRIGGRIAIGVKATLGDQEIAMVCVHLESIGDPKTRAAQTALLIDAIDAYAPGLPILVGGDFNTDTGDSGRPDRREWKRATARKQPARFANPVPYEPLFALMATHGYVWEGCNAPGVTERTRPDGTPDPPLAKLDWYFVRDLIPSSPVIEPAVDADGLAISDHEMIVVDIRLRT